MIPRMGEKYPIEIETFSKPREEYRSGEHARLGWPVAPAIVVGDELLVQGQDIAEEKLEAAIRRHLGIQDCETGGV